MNATIIVLFFNHSNCIWLLVLKLPDDYLGSTFNSNGVLLVFVSVFDVSCLCDIELRRTNRE